MHGFSPARLTAMRMWIAKLGTDVQRVPFDLEELGWEWLAPPDLPCAVVSGMEVTCGDLQDGLYSLWHTVMCALAKERGVSLGQVISDLGLGVAEAENAAGPP